MGKNGKRFAAAYASRGISRVSRKPTQKPSSASRQTAPPPRMVKKKDKRQSEPAQSRMSRAALAAETDKLRQTAKGSCGPYVAGDMILLVGDGDFSFASALLARLGTDAYIVATALDDSKSLRKKYPNARANIQRLEAAGMQVMYGIDCRRLHETEDFQGAFTKIVFNFPHLGTDGADIEEHRRLLREFLSAAASCLEALPSAEIHITIRSGEPYNSWKVQQLAKDVDSDDKSRGRGGEGKSRLRCDRVVPFEAKHYRGYQHQRTRGEAYAKARGLEDHNVVEGARTYVFKLRKEALQAAEGE
eukprot:TRINITY_DN55934_c0_g1_i1.p1 TRINITY_DN55934_c0_g1~~TRINITY_DN55934_c0_g1_i1.p1  ORF type:complete len:303 (-),score=50.53 TRINITY_DN55934_c0_g1_i1:148-1056(-)